MPVDAATDQELWDRLAELEFQLDQVAAAAWDQGFRLRIVVPTGDVIAEWHNPQCPKQVPALRFVRPVIQGPTSR